MLSLFLQLVREASDRHPGSVQEGSLEPQGRLIVEQNSLYAVAYARMSDQFLSSYVL